MAVHVVNGGGNFLRLQVAYRLARTKTRVSSQVGSHARLFLRLAGHGCGKIPLSAPPTVEGHAQERSSVRSSDGEDFPRSRSFIWRRTLRTSPTVGRLDGNDRDDSHSTFWNVSAFGTGMAPRGNRCRADHERATAIEIDQRILGTALERRF